MHGKFSIIFVFSRRQQKRIIFIEAKENKNNIIPSSDEKLELQYRKASVVDMVVTRSVQLFHSNFFHASEKKSFSPD